MPIAQVQGPDGRVAEFEVPDGTTPEQVTAHAQQFFAEQGKDSTLAHKAKLFGSDVVKGLLGFPAMVADTAREVINIPFTAGENVVRAARGQEIQAPELRGPELSRQLQAAGTQPETAAERWQSALTQGAAGGALPVGAVAPIKGAVTGMTAAAGGQGAKEAGAGPMAQLLASLLGGVGGSFAANRLGAVRPQVSELAHEAVEGVDPTQLQQARTFMEGAQRSGASVDLPQSLEAIGAPANNLTTLRNVLAQSRHGDKVQAGLRQQPEELAQLSTMQVGKMPGAILPETQAANNMQEAATQVLQGAKDQGSELWRQTLKTSSDAQKKAATEMLAKAMLSKGAADTTLKGAKADASTRLSNALSGAGEPQDFLDVARPLAEATAGVRVAQEGVRSAKQGVRNARAVAPETVLQAVRDLGAKISASPNTAKAALLKRLQGNLLRDDGTPITDPNQLNEILKSESSKLKTINIDTPGVDAGTAKWMGGQIDSLRKFFGESFSPVRDANKAFAKHRQEVYNPLKQGPVGQLAGKGYKGDVQAPLARMESLFSRGVNPSAKHSPIREAAEELSKVDKTAFADAAKTYYSGRINKAFDSTIAGKVATNADAAARLYDSVFKDAHQYQGMKDAVAGVAKSFGKSEKDAVRGLEAFAQIAKALKNRPKDVGGLRTDEVFKMAGQNYGSDALRVFGFLPFEQAARRMEDRLLGNVFRDFDNMLTTPEGVDRLIELSKKPVMSKAAIAVLSGTGGTVPQAAGQ